MDKYRKMKTLGRGSFGAAILVRRVADDQKFVLKRIDTSRMSAKEKQEVQVEIDVLSHLDSPCIVQYHEHFQHKKGMCIVMEYADGGDLGNQIQNACNANRYISEEAILNWFVQICMGLKHCHDRKILHRDLKSQNIFLTSTGLVKLGDFGIARVLLATAEMASTVVGTPYYLSPEIVENKKYNAKSDIWSLGVVLYELAALQVPFSGSSLPQLVINIARGKYPPPPVHFSKQLHELIDAMLKHDPADRPTVSALLWEPLIAARIRAVFGATMAQDEMSHTVLHGRVHAPVAAKRKSELDVEPNGSKPNGDCPLQDAKPARSGFSGHKPKKPVPKTAKPCVSEVRVTPPEAGRPARRPPGVHGKPPGSNSDQRPSSSQPGSDGAWWEKSQPPRSENKRPFLTRGSGQQAYRSSSRSPPTSRAPTPATNAPSRPAKLSIETKPTAPRTQQKVVHSPISISTGWTTASEGSLMSPPITPVKSPAQHIKQSIGASVGIDFSQMDPTSSTLLTGSTAVLGTTAILNGVGTTNWQTCTWKREAACFWNAAPAEEETDLENEIASDEEPGQQPGTNSELDEEDCDAKAKQDEVELVNMLREMMDNGSDDDDDQTDEFTTAPMNHDEDSALVVEEECLEALEFEAESMSSRLVAQLGRAQFEQLHRVVTQVVHEADSGTGNLAGQVETEVMYRLSEIDPRGLVREATIQQIKQLVDLQESLELMR
eukprot:TRINITY_DN1613_c0_g1_i4.p1 TRINITY_DN1613_c0_g1~~TRINITY_DN1613_c0_g1_i4.p1  ORF type:complete len:718 (-),score=178.61 TRINITY_DN1613_c0_g1_i4:36-2189(-)